MHCRWHPINIVVKLVSYRNWIPAVAVLCVFGHSNMLKEYICTSFCFINKNYIGNKCFILILNKEVIIGFHLSQSFL